MIEIDSTAPEGNAYYILGTVRKTLKAMDKTEEEIDKVIRICWRKPLNN